MNKWLGGGLRNFYLLNFLVFYYVVLLFGYFNHFFLSQFQPVYFHLNHDIAELAVIFTGLPKFLISNPGMFFVLDFLILVLPLINLAYFLKMKKYSFILGFFFSLLLYLYLLLQSIFKQMSLQPFVGYVILSAMFFLNRKEHFHWVIKMARWAFIYAFGTAGVWKILRGAVFEKNELSNILIMQHSNYLTNNCTDFLCQVHFFLIENPVFSQALYVGATLLELAFLVGFFTKKYDKWLVVLAFTFVFFDQLVMRIPYWTILVSAVPLWFSKRVDGSIRISEFIKSKYFKKLYIF